MQAKSVETLLKFRKKAGSRGYFIMSRVLINDAKILILIVRDTACCITSKVSFLEKFCIKLILMHHSCVAYFD
jgi:hypothetical protein